MRSWKPEHHLFKIEGRLKDAAYVKNVTAYYRRKLDEIIDAAPDRYQRSSFGQSEISFEPDPAKASTARSRIISSTRESLPE